MKHRGFTLIELIVSVTILSIIVSSIYSVFYMGIKTWRRQNEGGYFQKTRLKLLRLQKQLKSSFYFSKVPFRGTSSEIVFPLILSKGDIDTVHIITYRIMDDEAKPEFKKLVKEEKVFGEDLLDEEEKKEDIFSAKTIKFEYPYKEIGSSEKLEWQDFWNESQNKIPSGVKISFNIEGKDEVYNKLIIIPQGELGSK